MSYERLDVGLDTAITRFINHRLYMTETEKQINEYSNKHF